MLKACIEECGKTGIIAPRFMRFAAVYMAEALGKAGRISDGHVAIEEALGRADCTGELWEYPELMRVEGGLLLLRGTSGDSAAAEDCFRQAVDVARRQGALSWELRAATSLAHLLKDHGRLTEARELLGPIHVRFTEGFDTADLKAAKALLDALR